MSTIPPNAVRVTLLRAIQIEARNAGVYDSLEQLFRGYDDSITAIFREMAAEERQHGAELEQRYFELFGPLAFPASEPKEVIEAPDLNDPEALIFDAMTIEQALEVGLRAEEMARQFYRREAACTADPELKTVYRELAEFEDTHVRLLEEKLAAIRRPGGPPLRCGGGNS